MINKPNIFIPLTFDNDLAFDLLYKIKKISKKIPNLYIYIRTHPLMNNFQFENFLDDIEMNNFEYANSGKIQDWFTHTDMVISSGNSITIVEAIGSGKPVVRVEPDNAFLLDPFAWTDYPYPPVGNVDELEKIIKKFYT